MANLNLRGPERMGAGELDEGYLTEAVCAAYAQTDGKQGQATAAAILPLRRALWKAAEEFCRPHLASALRARLESKDPSGRMGVRELRAAVADWLAPPPRCRRCGRALAPSLTGIERPVCTAATPRVYCGRGRRPRGPLCVAPKGVPKLYPPTAVPPDRCGTLPLFGPVEMGDPFVTACLTRHTLLTKGKGSRHYDIACDRDGRSLLAATDPKTPGGHHPVVRLVRHQFDRAIDRAMRENGRLILATQRKHFTAAGGTTRANLVQAGAMGCRRALMDYDATREPRCSIASYAIAWIYQYMGEEFGQHDLVAPAWVGALRTKLVGAGVDPWKLSAGISHVAGTRHMRPVGLPNDATADEKAEARRLSLALRKAAAEELVSDLMAAMASAPVAAPPRRHASTPAPDIVVNHGAVLADKWPTGQAAVRSLLAAATDPPRVGKHIDGGEERARERVAGWCAGFLGVKATGQAILAALRAGAGVTATDATINPGEDDGLEDGAPSLRNANCLAHADVEADDEDSAEVEAEARERWAQVNRALESLREEDPEAAEVVRRRTGLAGARDGLQDGETLEQITSAPLASTGRTLCRESVRRLYERGRSYLAEACLA